jgi:integrase
MASIARDPKGRKRVIFVAEDGSRKTIRLGKTSIKQAKAFKVKLEALIAAQFTGSMDDETARWITDMSDSIHAKLAKVGLVKPRAAQPEQQKFTFSEWVNQYIEKRSDVKPRTKSNWQNAAKKLLEFFQEQSIDEITVQQAKDFRVYLKSVAGLNENTLRREIGLARQFFNAAIDAELITKNPFKGQPVSVRANPARFYYVKQEIALKVLEACPDAQWRLIFGLARWGGLRCPSEVLRLKWQDVDFEHSRFIVHASKTAHHADSGIRTVPMFPELKPLFQDAFDNAQDGDVFCITRYRDKSTNLRTRLTRYIRRAGLEPWPKLFQNLRSTRETELFKMTNGNIKAVCSWIGNSPKVALEHYAQVTEADLKEAAKMSLLSDGEKAAQNTAQYDAVTGRKEPQTALNEYKESAFLPLNAALCGSVHEQQVPPRGVEPLSPG